MFAICPSVRPSVFSSVTNLVNTFEKNELILMHVCTSSLRGSIKQSTFGVRRSKIKVTRDRNRLQKSISERYLKNSLTNFNQTWQAHITVNGHCVTRTRKKKVKGQGRTRPKIDLEAWRRHHSPPH